MNELIKITEQTIGTDEVNAVDARELWEFLEIPTQFSKWFSRRISEYNFTQDTDFITKVNSDFSPPRKEYTISIDMAKELSMVEKNHKGKEARKYFIACEKKLKSKKHTEIPFWNADAEGIKSILDMFNAPEHIVASEIFKHVHSVGGPDLRNVVGSLPCSQNILIEDVMLEPTELGTHFNLGAREMNKTLMNLGLQYNDVTGWIPTRIGKDMSIRHAWTAGNKSGYNLKWNLNKVRDLMENI